MPQLLQDKVAIVTGGTSGIGKATALLFAQEGAHVVITGRHADKGNVVVQQIVSQSGPRSIFFTADHTNPDDCQRSVNECISTFGRLDILVNNAGIVTQGCAESVTEADWDQSLDINLKAVWRMSSMCLPYLRSRGPLPSSSASSDLTASGESGDGGTGDPQPQPSLVVGKGRHPGPLSGCIVNVASDWGLMGAKNAVIYCATKGAVVNMTKAMALDHAPEGIRINAVCPGDTLVERWSAPNGGYFVGSGPVSRRQALLECAQDIPLARVGHVDEVAKAILFLASNMSSFVTGSCLSVDGGTTAGTL